MRLNLDINISVHLVDTCAAREMDVSWRFQKSIKVGPFRINLSKSGVGYSVGTRGLRLGRDAKGRNYTNVSIPGTGISNRTYHQSSSAKQQTHRPIVKTTGNQLKTGSNTNLLPAAVVIALLLLWLITR